MTTATDNASPVCWQEHYAGQTVLISGAHGYIGSALVRALDGTAGELRLLVRESGDIAAIDTWRRVLPGVAAVFHLAAYEHRHGYQHDPLADMRVNALAMLQLLEACRLEGLAPAIVFASSSNLAGLPARLPVSEDAPDDPLTVYAIHKLTAERYLRHYGREFGIPGLTLRLANVYGPAPNAAAAGRITLNAMIGRAAAGEPLRLFGNHACLRDYVFIDDVVSALLLGGVIAPRQRGEVFLIGSGAAVTFDELVGQIVAQVRQRTGRQVAVHRDDDQPLEPVAWRQFVADTARFRAAAAWEPHTPLDEGIRRTLDSLLAD